MVIHWSPFTAPAPPSPRRRPEPSCVGHHRRVSRARVLHLLPALGIGGTERLVLELCAHLDAERFEQHVVLSRARSVTPWWPEALDPRVPVHLARDRVAATLAALDPALVHAPYWGVDDPALRALVADPDGVGVVLSATDGHEPLRGPAIRSTVFCCAAQRDAVDPPPEPSTVIHNGISPPLPITAGGARRRPPRAGARRRRRGGGGDGPAPARQGERRRLRRGRHPARGAAGATVLVLGTGDRLAAWRRRAAACGAGDRVRFCGLVPRPRTRLAAADLFLHPVRRDTFPYAVLEALGSGLPVAALDLPGLREMCAGAAVLAETPAELGRAAAALLADPGAATARRRGRRPLRALRDRATAAAYARVFEAALRPLPLTHSTSPK